MTTTTPLGSPRRARGLLIGMGVLLPVIGVACGLPSNYVFDDSKFQAENAGGSANAGASSMGASGGASGTSQGMAGTSAGHGGSSGTAGMENGGTAGASLGGSAGTGGISGSAGSSGNGGTAGNAGMNQGGTGAGAMGGSGGMSMGTGGSGAGGSGGSGGSGPTICTTSATCPTGVQGMLVAGTTCSYVTAQPSACGASQICGSLSAMGSTYQGSCHAVDSSKMPIGTACTGNTQCQSGFCDGYTKQCTQLCGADTDCGSGNVCILVGYSSGANAVTFVNQCRKPCTHDADCPMNSFGTGICTLSTDWVSDQYWSSCELPYQGATYGMAGTMGCASGLTVTTSSNMMLCSKTCINASECTNSMVATCGPANLSMDPTGQPGSFPVMGTNWCIP